MNKSTLSNVLIFMTGAAIGSLVAWKLSKDYYKKLADEEIAEVKQHFSEMTAMKKELEVVTERASKVVEDESKHDPKGNLADLAYFASKYITHDDKKPYLINPDVFGDLCDEGYETETLTYYADGVLADDMDIIIEDIDAMVGLESLDHFGDYEKDVVFVRNEKHKADYEICRDTRTYVEVVGSHSFQEGD